MSLLIIKEGTSNMIVSGMFVRTSSTYEVIPGSSSQDESRNQILRLHIRTLSTGSVHPVLAHSSGDSAIVLDTPKSLSIFPIGLQIYASLVAVTRSSGEGLRSVDVWNWQRGERVWVGRVDIYLLILPPS